MSSQTSNKHRALILTSGCQCARTLLYSDISRDTRLIVRQETHTFQCNLPSSDVEDMELSDTTQVTGDH